MSGMRREDSIADIPIVNRVGIDALEKRARGFPCFLSCFGVFFRMKNVSCEMHTRVGV